MKHDYSYKIIFCRYNNFFLLKPLVKVYKVGTFNLNVSFQKILYIVSKITVIFKNQVTLSKTHLCWISHITICWIMLNEKLVVNLNLKSSVEKKVRVLDKLLLNKYLIHVKIAHSKLTKKFHAFFFQNGHFKFFS